MLPEDRRPRPARKPQAGVGPVQARYAPSALCGGGIPGEVVLNVCRLVQTVYVGIRNSLEMI